ncbi:MAG: peptidase, partial [Nitrosopumilus sp.]|nr:peptidase [Nitrosopumilus sp.]
KEDVLKIPPTTQGAVSGSNDIPVWIKSNAEWWAAGQIDDDSFIQGIQYLIKEGIMRIQS